MWLLKENKVVVVDVNEVWRARAARVCGFVGGETTHNWRRE